MSSEKTESLHMHRWTPNDPFLRSEVNENFTAIDAQKCEVVFGTYRGNGTGRDSRQDIALGRRAKVVFICAETINHDSTNEPRFTMVVDGRSAQGAEITETGFYVKVQISSNGFMYYPALNTNGITYMYAAFF